ncbi:hypothetical protein F3Y22_tig00111463pilonHSYRG00069 [Hibiscus syriacus]|uniref:Reverse transcriptase/retrotransposon-derived protein RNase H-like domain-containing protein n=1 Tax=Hibiscus syriacus TaxID=106335 RepID=A0A6A2XQY1_HIBSY|nr:hypothetical protein F3Y22_tig00111463pilonHSYRG00069 [Hibiscus syriacus]
MGLLQILNTLKAKSLTPTPSNGLIYVEAVINEKSTRAMVDTGATHNFVSKEEANRLGLKYNMSTGWLKTVNARAIPLYGVVRGVELRLGTWNGQVNFSVVPIDDFKVSELRSFLGLVNYYHQFIQCYLARASPLTDLLKKGKTWEWSKQYQKVFDDLKEEMSQEPILALPDFTKPFEVHTDASDFAIGGVLMQEGHPIAFESHNLNDTERRYTVQEKEITTIIHCLRVWRHYLLGAHFTIKTDNVTTSYFQTQKKLSPKQAKWKDFLAEFDYTLEYKPSKTNIVADTLSLP